jgi:hypothetical protein
MILINKLNPGHIVLFFNNNKVNIEYTEKYFYFYENNISIFKYNLQMMHVK